ncbi:hypothetical protein BG841_14230 [Marinobacter sp. X15-166B]|nr:hypothetical protein BG841_14230 [Marinobacter sp. X15-166B]
MTSCSGGHGPPHFLSIYSRICRCSNDAFPRITIGQKYLTGRWVNQLDIVSITGNQFAINQAAKL